MFLIEHINLYIWAVKMAEKLNENFVLKYYQYLKYIRFLKGLISVGGGLLDAASEQKLTNAHFFKAIKQHEYL